MLRWPLICHAELSAAGLHELIVRVRLIYRADFETVFVDREMPGEQRGKELPTNWKNGALGSFHDSRVGRGRNVQVQFAPAPETDIAVDYGTGPLAGTSRKLGSPPTSVGRGVGPCRAESLLGLTLPARDCRVPGLQRR